MKFAENDRAAAVVIRQPIKKRYFSILTRNGVVEKLRSAPPHGEEHTPKAVGKNALFQNGGNPGGNLLTDFLTTFADLLSSDGFTQAEVAGILEASVGTVCIVRAMLSLFGEPTAP